MLEPTVLPGALGQLRPGAQLNGIYEISRFIADGGMGEVYQGFNTANRYPVAIKVIKSEWATNEDILALFEREAAILMSLHHEAIVRYFGFHTDPVLRRHYVVMEFVDGVSLAGRLETGPLSLEEARVLKSRIGGALQAAHRLGIVHRDISSDNIILPNGEIRRAMLIDFGIARSHRPGDRSIIGNRFAGKLTYASPEQISGGTVTAKSDMYSFGLVLAEALLGKPIDMRGSMTDIVEKRRRVPDLSSIDPAIRPLIHEMLEPNPEDRPEDMSVVAAWVEAAPRPSAIDPAPRLLERPRPNPENRSEDAGAAWRGDIAPKRTGAKWAWGLATLAVLSLSATALVFRDDVARVGEPWLSASNINGVPDPTKIWGKLVAAPHPSTKAGDVETAGPAPAPRTTPAITVIEGPAAKPSPTAEVVGSSVSPPDAAPREADDGVGQSGANIPGRNVRPSSATTETKNATAAAIPTPPSDEGPRPSPDAGATQPQGPAEASVSGTPPAPVETKNSTAAAVPTPPTDDGPRPSPDAGAAQPQGPAEASVSGTPPAPVETKNSTDAAIPTPPSDDESRPSPDAGATRPKGPAEASVSGTPPAPVETKNSTATAIPTPPSEDEPRPSPDAGATQPQGPAEASVSPPSTRKPDEVPPTVAAGEASQEPPAQRPVGGVERPSPPPEDSVPAKPPVAPDYKVTSLDPKPLVGRDLELRPAEVGRPYQAELSPFTDPNGDGFKLEAEPLMQNGLEFRDLGQGLAMISGSAKTAGAYRFHLRATDANGRSATSEVTLTVASLEPPPPAEAGLGERQRQFLRGYDSGSSCFLVRQVANADGSAAMAGYSSDPRTFQRFAEAYRKALGADPELNAQVIDGPECPTLSLARLSLAGNVPAPQIVLQSSEVGPSRPLAGTVTGLAGRDLKLLAVEKNGDVSGLGYSRSADGKSAVFNVPLKAPGPDDFGHAISVLAIVSTHPFPALASSRLGVAKDLAVVLLMDWTKVGASADARFVTLTR